jgi:hypothetical protein
MSTYKTVTKLLQPGDLINVVDDDVESWPYKTIWLVVSVITFHQSVTQLTVVWNGNVEQRSFGHNNNVFTISRV